jgi:NADH dehydrogenase
MCDRLLARGFAVRAAARHPARARPPEVDGQRFEAVHGDVLDEASVRRAVEDAHAVVNAVSLYQETPEASFRDVHVEGAQAVATAARLAGAGRLIQLSGVGADPESDSPYISARGRGEEAVRTAYPTATIFRPCVMCGPGDGFLTMLASLIRRFPVLPLFGEGTTRMQPVFVGDVAEAGARVLAREDEPAALYEFGGPTVYTYRQLLSVIAAHEGRQPQFVPMPFAVWDVAAGVSERLPHPPMNAGQVDLMKRDNAVTGRYPGLADLDIPPTAIETLLPEVV